MENLQDKIKSLPLEIQDAITSPEFGEKLDIIGHNHKLHIDQIGELANETGLILLGEKKSSDFLDNITKALDISAEKAASVVADINAEIFLPLREVLQDEQPTPKPEVENHHLETPDEILKHIEDGGLELPAPEKTNIPEPQPVPTPAPEPAKPAPAPEQEATNLTDHLMNNTIASPHVEETKVEKKYSVDPYREPIM